MVGFRFQALIYVENVHVDELKSKENLLWYPARYLISPVQVDYCPAKNFWDNKWKIEIHLCIKFLIGRSVEAILVIHKMNKYGCLWHLGESRGLISPCDQPNLWIVDPWQFANVQELSNFIEDRASLMISTYQLFRDVFEASWHSKIQVVIRPHRPPPGGPNSALKLDNNMIN